ncbi:MAG: MATE family efflux transporter, partial [Butyricicoccus sp.]
MTGYDPRHTVEAHCAVRAADYGRKPSAAAYNTADTIIVGNFNSQQALSAVGSCASLTALFTALAIGFSIGAGVLISQYFGANRLEDLRRYASSSIVLM